MNEDEDVVVAEDVGGMDESPEIGPGPQIDVTDETIQRQFDLETLDATITNIRAAMAKHKVNLILANNGLQEKNKDMHPQKVREAIKETRKALDLMIVARRELTPTGMPEPSALEVAQVIPTK